MRRIWIAAVLMAALGCGDPGNEKTVYEPAAKELLYDTKRFSVEFHGRFRGGHDNNVRDVFVLKDLWKGGEYLVITGAGATELHTEIHTTTDPNGQTQVHTETVEE